MLALVEKMSLPLENPGIHPGASRMLSGRSTIWANSPAHMHLESCDSVEMRFCNRVDLNNTDSILYSNREYWLKSTLELYASAGRVDPVYDSGNAFTVSFRCSLKNSEHQL